MRMEESIGPSYAIPAEEWGPGYRVWEELLTVLAQRGPDGTTSLVRVASHLMVILVAVLVIAVSRLDLPGWEIAEVRDSATNTPLEAGAAPVERRASAMDTLVRAAVPFTLMADNPRSIDISSYTVQPGDTLYSIADRFNVSAETVMWANNMELNPDLLRLGQEVTVLPIDGVLHTAAFGDTVESIARKYKVDPGAIIGFEWNRIKPQNPVVSPGQRVIVPGGVKAAPPKPTPIPRTYVSRALAPAKAPQGAGRFAWPTRGQITTVYRPYHYAIDIANNTGTPVKASDAGYIATVIYSRVGYGNHVIIDHGNGFQTLYAHMSKIYVKAGDTVSQGTSIGAVGSTGHSTGPHLHFEVRLNGSARNPFGYLP